MTAQKAVEIAVVNALEGALGVPVIRSNQTAPVPPYPYFSYTVVTLAHAGGSWALDEKGREYKDIPQTWSFTVQSDDATRAVELAMEAFGWFDSQASNLELTPLGVVVSRVGDVGNRDNFLTIAYEYREGFDVTFVIRHRAAKTLIELAGEIETMDFIKEEMVHGS